MNEKHVSLSFGYEYLKTMDNTLIYLRMKKNVPFPIQTFQSFFCKQDTTF